LWPRVEISGSFVLSKLRRFLYFVQNRVEMAEMLCQNRSGFAVYLEKNDELDGGRWAEECRWSFFRHSLRRIFLRCT